MWEETNESFEELARRVPSSTQRMIIRDCIALSLIDGDYSKRERAAVRSIADAFGVTLDVVGQLESWVERYSSLMEEGEALLLKA